MRGWSYENRKHQKSHSAQPAVCLHRPLRHQIRAGCAAKSGRGLFSKGAAHHGGLRRRVPIGAAQLSPHRPVRGRCSRPAHPSGGVHQDRANLRALDKTAQHHDPELSSNPYSRWQQRRAIKKEYAAAKSAGRGAGNTVRASETAAKGARKAGEGARKAGEFIQQHKKAFLIAGGIAAMLVLILCTVSSCSLLIQGGATGVNVSTYPSEDADMLAAEAAYCAMEDELRDYLDNYESTHDYDEYRYELGDIEHDPYVLISAVTALIGREWTLLEVGGILDMLFEKQYILTETVATETRYRTETRTGRRRPGKHAGDRGGRAFRHARRNAGAPSGRASAGHTGTGSRAA